MVSAARRRIDVDPEQGSALIRREPSPSVRRKPPLYLVSSHPRNRLTTTTYDVQGCTSVAGGRKPGAATYNHQHQRTRKVVGKTTTVYHYGLNGELLAETTNTGTLIRAYVYDDEAPIAQVTKGTTDTLVHLHADPLGTPRIGTDPARSTVWRYDGNAFGDTLPNEDPDGNRKKTTVNLRFPGQYYDQETGLHYNWHRYYDPRIGRYITSDPVGLEGGLNTYAYVSGNPLRYFDPNGLAGVPTPTDPSGRSLPPPVSLPPGKDGQPNQWVPVRGSGSGTSETKWKPKFPVQSPGGGQPSASWDPHGHWDVDDGKGGRKRYDENGRPVDHDNKPICPEKRSDGLTNEQWDAYWRLHGPYMMSPFGPYNPSPGGQPGLPTRVPGTPQFPVLRPILVP